MPPGPRLPGETFHFLVPCLPLATTPVAGPSLVPCISTLKRVLRTTGRDDVLLS